MVRKVGGVPVRLVALVLCWLWILPAHAILRLQLLTPPGGESAKLATYLDTAIKDDLVISTSETLDPRAELLIVFSAEALKSLPAGRPPVLCILPEPGNADLHKQDSALYWTPSLAAQLALIRVILPATNKVGMLVNDPDDASWLRQFRQYAGEQSIEVRVLPADKPHIARQVAELAASTDVLLAQPDTDIYNRDTIRFILLAAYRQNRVLIGPSPAFVNAGALATLYAPPTAIADEVAQKVRYFIRNAKLPAASRVRHFSVSLNPQVAKSLGLTVPAINELERLLRIEELPSWP